MPFVRKSLSRPGRANTEIRNQLTTVRRDGDRHVVHRLLALLRRHHDFLELLRLHVGAHGTQNGEHAAALTPDASVRPLMGVVALTARIGASTVVWILARGRRLALGAERSRLVPARARMLRSTHSGRVDERDDPRDADGAEPVERVGVAKLDGFRTDRIAEIHVGADRAAYGVELRQRKAGSLQYRVDEPGSDVRMVCLGIGPRRERRHVMQISGGEPDVVVESHAVRGCELASQRIVAR